VCWKEFFQAKFRLLSIIGGSSKAAWLAARGAEVVMASKTAGSELLRVEIDWELVDELGLVNVTLPPELFVTGEFRSNSRLKTQP
jgi:hypothetical protein